MMVVINNFVMQMKPMQVTLKLNLKKWMYLVVLMKNSLELVEFWTSKIHS
jgi:hypothetical protein